MLASLFAHLRWADERALASIERMPQNTVERDRAVAIYAHLAAAEHIWLARLEGRMPVHPVWPGLSITEASRLAKESAHGLVAYLSRCSESDIDAVIRYNTSAGDTKRSMARDILLHVALHDSYHRGQLASMTRGAGVEPASTDYIVYARETLAP